MRRWRVPDTDWLFGRPWRVVLLVALVVALPILVVGQLSADATRQRLRDEQLRETSAVAARAGDAVSSQVEGILEQLSLALSISDLRSALEASDQARVDDLLRTFRRRMSADIVRLIALDRSLNVLTLDPPDPSLAGKQIGQHDFLSALRKANLRAEGALYSDLYKADGTSAQTVSIAIAVLSPRGREGPFSGALVAELDPARLAAWVAPLLASADEIYLVDRSGRLIVRATAPAAERGRDLGADPIVAAALAHAAVTDETTDPFGRGSQFVSTVELDPLGWHVVAERSTAGLQRSLDEVLGQLLISRVVLVAVLLLTSYVIAVALQRVRRLEQREREHMRRALDRMNEQLRIARDIQTALLPKSVQAPPGYRLEAYYQPAADVGGDFYDIVHLPDGRSGLIVGDVTGHGIGAALLMAATVSTLRAEAPLHDSPGAVLARVNDKICEEIPAGNFVTCLYAVLDPQSGSLHFANAGHPIPYVRTREGVVEARARGMPLGLIPGSVYEERRITLAVGDHTIFYTDGITEAHQDGEMFGEPRLKQVLAEGQCGQQFIDLLLARIRQLTGPGWEQDDDITLVSLERAGE
jgi:serine phosphatase RsbU (regulator of sigma subunit)